jgi:hypothetical protein
MRGAFVQQHAMLRDPWQAFQAAQRVRMWCAACEHVPLARWGNYSI